LAEYRDAYESLRAAGANLVAVSVDAPEKSEAVRRDWQLPFLILSDRRRRVVQEWGIYNAREKGGIAKPAVFLLSPDLTVRFASVDQVASRVPATEIVRLLREGTQAAAVNRKSIVPGPATFLVAIRGAFRMGATQDSNTND
jgi:peroxiredoxin